MNRKDILKAISTLSSEQRTKWLIKLGWEMTISARAGYPLAMQVENKIAHLVAFNEMQHQLYNYLQHSRTKEDWKIEDFFEGLCQKASSSGINNYFGVAVKSSLRNVAT